MGSRGVVAGTPAGLRDTQLANDLDIHEAAQILCRLRSFEAHAASA
jgi:hypothetical protein